MATTRTHGRRFLPWVTLLVASGLAAIHVLFGAAPATWVFDRAAVLTGDLTRLLSGHLVHLSDKHALINIAAFAILGAAYEDSAAARRRMVVILMASVAAISAAIVWLTPQTAFYCGISAVLNALFAALCVKEWRRTGHWFWPLLLFGDLAKIAFEWQFGSVFSGELAWPPHYGAHLTGWIVGVFIECAACFYRRGNYDR